MAETKTYDVEYAWRDDGRGNRLPDSAHTQRVELTDAQAERFRGVIGVDGSSVVAVTEVEGEE